MLWNSCKVCNMNVDNGGHEIGGLEIVPQTVAVKSKERWPV